MKNKILLLALALCVVFTGAAYAEQVLTTEFQGDVTGSSPFEEHRVGTWQYADGIFEGVADVVTYDGESYLLTKSGRLTTPLFQGDLVVREEYSGGGREGRYRLESLTGIWMVSPTVHLKGRMEITNANGFVTVNDNRERVKPELTPQISELVPIAGNVGSIVKIHGRGFGPAKSPGTVMFGFDVLVPAVVGSWSDSLISCRVPNIKNGQTVINVIDSTGTPAGQRGFSVGPAPVISYITPTSGPVRRTVKIEGFNFGKFNNVSAVKFGGVTAANPAWGNSVIYCGVPDLPSGSYPVTVTTSEGICRSNEDFTVITVAGESKPNAPKARK